MLKKTKNLPHMGKSSANKNTEQQQWEKVIKTRILYTQHVVFGYLTKTISFHSKS